MENFLGELLSRAAEKFGALGNALFWRVVLRTTIEKDSLQLRGELPGEPY